MIEGKSGDRNVDAAAVAAVDAGESSKKRSSREPSSAQFT